MDATIQPIPYPLSSPPIKSTTLQSRWDLEDHVIGLTELQIGDICISYEKKANEIRHGNEISAMHTAALSRGFLSGFLKQKLVWNALSDSIETVAERAKEVSPSRACASCFAL